MKPVAYLFCVRPDPPEASGTVVLEEEGKEALTSVTVTVGGDDSAALVEVYRQLQLVADDAGAPWNQRRAAP